MPVSMRKYRAPHTSEREFAVKNCCRLVVLVAARGFETLGEQLQRQNGDCYGHKQRMALVDLLRRHAAEHKGVKPTEAAGFNREDALYAYAKAFPSGRAISVDPTPDEMWDLLNDGWFLSVSGNTDDVRSASQLDDWVNDVPHEMGIVPWPKSKDQVRVVEPMRPMGKGYAVATWQDVVRFSSEFATNGRRVVIKVRTGYDTRVARRGRLDDDLIRDKNAALARLREQRDALTDEVRRVTLDHDAIEAQLTECREDRPDVGSALDAIEERFADLIAGVREDYA